MFRTNFHEFGGKCLGEFKKVSFLHYNELFCHAKKKKLEMAMINHNRILCSQAKCIILEGISYYYLISKMTISQSQAIYIYIDTWTLKHIITRRMRYIPIQNYWILS